MAYEQIKDRFEQFYGFSLASADPRRNLTRDIRVDLASLVDLPNYQETVLTGRPDDVKDILDEQMNILRGGVENLIRQNGGYKSILHEDDESYDVYFNTCPIHTDNVSDEHKGISELRTKTSEMLGALKSKDYQKMKDQLRTDFEAKYGQNGSDADENKLRLVMAIANNQSLASQYYQFQFNDAVTELEGIEENAKDSYILAMFNQGLDEANQNIRDENARIDGLNIPDEEKERLHSRELDTLDLIIQARNLKEQRLERARQRN